MTNEQLRLAEKVCALHADMHHLMIAISLRMRHYRDDEYVNDHLMHLQLRLLSVWDELEALTLAEHLAVYDLVDILRGMK
jgi:hypothetical protein